MAISEVYDEARGGVLVSSLVTTDPVDPLTERVDALEPTVDALVVAVLGG